MYNTNFGINFVLYCISGQNFRRALIEFWSKRRHPNKRFRDTQITTGKHYLRERNFEITILFMHFYADKRT
jgi:hypothetical protein